MAGCEVQAPLLSWPGCSLLDKRWALSGWLQLFGSLPRVSSWSSIVGAILRLNWHRARMQPVRSARVPMETMANKWLTSSSLKEPVQNDVPYTTQALRAGPPASAKCVGGEPGEPDRDAIYGYLTAVFDLVAWWAAENRALERAHKALRLQRMCPFDDEEPFAAIIRCTADPAKLTNAPDPNGHACCGMRSHTRLLRTAE